MLHTISLIGVGTWFVVFNFVVNEFFRLFSLLQPHQFFASLQSLFDLLILHITCLPDFTLRIQSLLESNQDSILATTKTTPISNHTSIKFVIYHDSTVTNKMSLSPVHAQIEFILVINSCHHKYSPSPFTIQMNLFPILILVTICHTLNLCLIPCIQQYDLCLILQIIKVKDHWVYH